MGLMAGQRVAQRLDPTDLAPDTGGGFGADFVCVYRRVVRPVKISLPVS